MSTISRCPTLSICSVLYQWPAFFICLYSVFLTACQLWSNGLISQTARHLWNAKMLLTLNTVHNVHLYKYHRHHTAQSPINSWDSPIFLYLSPPGRHSLLEAVQQHKKFQPNGSVINTMGGGVGGSLAGAPPRPPQRNCSNLTNGMATTTTSSTTPTAIGNSSAANGKCPLCYLLGACR